MCREDIYLNKKDFLEFVSLARMSNPELATILEESKEIISDPATGKSKYKIQVKNINEDDALNFLGILIDNELWSSTREEVREWGHLVEEWRPIAEGPL